MLFPAPGDKKLLVRGIILGLPGSSAPRASTRQSCSSTAAPKNISKTPGEAEQIKIPVLVFSQGQVYPCISTVCSNYG